ncbi:MAG: DNA polymerase I [Pseudomonadota bacterium]|nr:DNA polymerase I [Pseudomonadota bacterium]
MQTLLLVDGSSYLYRAFHALPDLRSPQGDPTGAIYGVINMLRKLRADYKPDYLACVMDAKGKTFRDDWYSDYKANRAVMPDDLSVQIEPLLETIRALGWPLLMVDGVEADDVIGTLARHAESRGANTVVSTGDKDLTQLVTAHVTLINTMSNETLDEAGVMAKFGVEPGRIVDYLTLVGDSVDNVPGVEKVGPKTAVKWLSQYQTLDNLIANAREIGGLVGDNLRKALDWLPQGRRLLTVKCDVDLPFEWINLTAKDADNTKLVTLFERFGFKSWRREFESAQEGLRAGGEGTGVLAASRAAQSAPPIAREFDTVLTEAALDSWIEKIKSASLVCVVTETTGLDPMTARIVGMSFSVEPHRGAYIPLAHRYAGAPAQLDFEQTLARLKPLLEDPSIKKLGQNVKYDRHIFANHGIYLNGIEHDTLLESYVLESHRPHDINSLASRHLDVKTIKLEEVSGKGVNQIGFDQVSVEKAAEYSTEDADLTLQLHHHLHPQIARDDKLSMIYRDIEMPVMQVLQKIERNGVLLDSALLAAHSHQLGKTLLDLEKKAHEQAAQTFNLNSPKQIQEILFDKLKLPVIKKTPSGTPSTDEDVLEKLALDYPLPKILLEYRGLAKLKSTYTDKLPRMVNPATGRVHTNYSQAVAVTGRLSSIDPNLQNIPVRTAEGRRIREAFIAPPGSTLLSADYSQIELRIMAHISGDQSLLRAFAAGEDIHRATAAEIFATERDLVTNEQRRYIKAINFGLIYGMSAFGLAAQLGIERSAAQAYIDRYFARYPGVAQYMQRTRETARNLGYVETVFGRRLWLPEIKSPNGPRRQAAERAAINAPMQGTAADLIKLAMIAVQDWLERERLESKIIMQVHDELVFEAPNAEVEMMKAVIPKLMTEVAELAAPLLVEVGAGPNWEAAH